MSKTSFVVLCLVLIALGVVGNVVLFLQLSQATAGWQSALNLANEFKALDAKDQANEQQCINDLQAYQAQYELLQ
jgi:hypothetical protein